MLHTKAPRSPASEYRHPFVGTYGPRLDLTCLDDEERRTDWNWLVHVRTIQSGKKQ